MLVKGGIDIGIIEYARYAHKCKSRSKTRSEIWIDERKIQVNSNDERGRAEARSSRPIEWLCG